jgi:Cu(I)/Ag(I) efflux system membrane fusion protein
MKRFLIFLCALVLTMLVVFTQRERISRLLKTGNIENAGPAVAYYTCSMHPQVHKDEPGNCPICHMPLVPVYQHQHNPQTRSEIVLDKDRISHAGIKTQAVKRTNLVRSVRATGRAAVDVELASAVREFISLGKDDPALYRAAVTRLKLLGMGMEEIRELERNPGAETLYRPAQGGLTWIYATIYESDLEVVRTGQTAVIRPSSAPSRTLTGVVRSISPIVDASRSLKARILVRDPENFIRPEAAVTVEIQAPLGSQLTVPRDAVLFSGTRQIVFVAEGAGRFTPRVVKTGQETAESIVILSGLKEGELVVSSGAFLIESESRLQSAMDEMEEQP